MYSLAVLILSEHSTRWGECPIALQRVFPSIVGSFVTGWSIANIFCGLVIPPTGDDRLETALWIGDHFSHNGGVSSLGDRTRKDRHNGGSSRSIVLNWNQEALVLPTSTRADGTTRTRARRR